MLEQIGDDALVDRLIVLDYELDGGPENGPLADWRSGIKNSDERQADFIERMCCLADIRPKDLSLTHDQTVDLKRFQLSVLLLADVMDLHSLAASSATK